MIKACKDVQKGQNVTFECFEDRLGIICGQEKQQKLFSAIFFQWKFLGIYDLKNPPENR